MSDTLPGLSAFAIYIGLALWQRRGWLSVQPDNPSPLFYGLATLALCLHGFSVYTLIDTVNGFNFEFFRVASLIFWVINITVLISSIKLP
ncbi:MAG TPA: hypothetical protein VLB90_10420, partial [Pseudomonadales bacterium]|nr:hypothetical protein [Pseudomonadales bacterium]